MKNKQTLLIAVLTFWALFFSPLRLFASNVYSEFSLLSRMAVLVIQLGVILFAAWSGGALFRKLKLPAVLGELVAGMLIGPYLLGSIPLIGFSSGLFPLQATFPVSAELYGFTTVASIILLFLVGLETDIETFFSFSVAGSTVGVGGVIVSFVSGDLLAVVFSKYLFGVQYGFMDPVPLFLGIISTATSVGISARILSEKRKMDAPEGVTILSGAVIDDVLGIIILAVVVGVVKSGHIEWKNIASIALKAITIWLGFTAIGLTFSAQLSKFLKKFRDKSTIAVMSLALALILAGIFEKSGLAMIVGAYIMGLSLSKTDLSYMIQGNLSILQKLLVPVFFCVMGMLVNLKEFTTVPIIAFGAIYTIVAILGKLVGCSIPSLFLNFNWRGALRIGVGMIPRGEVALIIAGIGLSTGLLQHEAFSVAIVMTFITTLITPPLFAKLLESDKPVLRKEKALRREYRQIVYTMPNPETSELILNKVIGAFESEGFYVHFMELPDKLYQIRKNETFITLKYTPEELVFDCYAEDVSFIHTVFYEVLAELEHVMKHLQTLTDTQSIGRKIFEGTPEKTLNGRGKLPFGKTRFSQLLAPLAVKVSLGENTKKKIIEELVDLLIKSGQLDTSKREMALRDLFEREDDISTGMQDGIALPHARTSAVVGIVFAVGLKKEGVDFDSIDRKPSKIFVITLAPKGTSESYLQFMAEITKFLMSEENRAKILSCSTDLELYQVFTSS